MAYEPAQAPELQAALDQPTSEARRAALRALVSKYAPLDPDDVKRIVAGSPICGTASNQVDVRPVYSGLRDQLCPGALLGLACGWAGWDMVEAALSNPSLFGVADASTKTGFAFGLHHSLQMHLNDLTARIKTDADAATTGAAMTTTMTLKTAGLANAQVAFDQLMKNRLEQEIASLESNGMEASHADLAALEREVIDLITATFGEQDTAALKALIEMRAQQGNRPDYTKAGVAMPGTSAGSIVADVIGHTAAATTVAVATPTAPAASLTVGPSPTGSVSPDGAVQVVSVPTPAAAKEEEPKPVLVEGQMTVGINAMLAAATGGKIADINAILGALHGQQIQVRALTQQVATLASRPLAGAAPTAFKSADGKTPNLNVKMVKAGTLDWNAPGGKAPKTLDFDVPLFQWTDDAGAAVEHPLVPAIDPHYKFRGAPLQAFLEAIAAGRKGILTGHTGSGKTTFFEQVCARLCLPMIRVNMDSEITPVDLLGMTHIEPDGKGGTRSYFREGILPKAMTQPCLFLIDEFDFIRPEISFVLNRMLEDKGLMLNEDGGRLVQAHPWFRVMATGNTKGQGDDTNVYKGAQVQSAAFLDRFTTMVEMPYLREKEEVDLLLKRVPALPKETAEQLVRFVGEIRNSFTQGEVYMTVSPRGLVSCAEKIVHFLPLVDRPKYAVDFALDVTILGKAAKQDLQKMKEFQDRCFK